MSGGRAYGLSLAECAGCLRTDDRLASTSRLKIGKTAYETIDQIVTRPASRPIMVSASASCMNGANRMRCAPISGSAV